MAELYAYTLAKPARTLYASITEASSARLENGALAEAKYSGTWGIEQEDLDAIIPIMVNAIKIETDAFTGPNDYFLACMSGKTAAKRVRAAGDFKASARGVTADDAFKIKEKAEKRATLYEKYPGILQASSKFSVSLARLEGGKVIDIRSEDDAKSEIELAQIRREIMQAGKQYFYPGSVTVPSIKFKAFRRKKLEDKDGCTAYLQNCLFVRRGEALAGGSGPSNNEVFGAYAGYSDVDPLAGAVTNADIEEEDIAF